MQWVLGILVAVGIAIFGVIHVFEEGNSAGQTSSVSDAITEVGDLSSKIQSDFPNGYTGLTNQIAINDNDIPSAYVVSGANITNGWGGAVTVEPDAANPAELEIVEGTVPAAACSHYAQGVSTVTSVTINGTSLTAPFTSAAVSAACADEVSSVSFIFSPAT